MATSFMKNKDDKSNRTVYLYMIQKMHNAISLVLDLREVHEQLAWVVSR